MAKQEAEDRVDETSVEYVAAFTKAAREQVAVGGGGGGFSRRRQGKNENLTTIRKTALTQDLVYSAEKNLARIKEMQSARREKLLKDESENYLFTLICRRYNHHGVYFTANPKSLGQISDQDWYASWRVDKDGKPDFTPYRGRIYCQGCFEEFGVKEQLPIIVLDEERGLWRPEERWAYKIAINEQVFERDGKRAIRIYELREEGSNLHFEDLERHRAEWDAAHPGLAQKVGAQ